MSLLPSPAGVPTESARIASSVEWPQSNDLPGCPEPAVPKRLHLSAENRGHKGQNPFIQHETSRQKLEPAPLPTQIQETYGQCNEDLIVEGLLRAKLSREGRHPRTMGYVEIGANHPIQTSNTYLFYRKWGACGLLCEANPALIPALQKARPNDHVVNAAVSNSSAPTVTFWLSACNELSSINRDHVLSFGRDREPQAVEVPTIHVNDLLAQAKGHLDFLSIDVEGLDLEILRSIDFRKYRPTIVQCEPSEHFKPGMGQDIYAFLSSVGYELAAVTDVNMIFVDAADRAVAAAKPRIRTFDVFDTLIARRHVSPHSIFRQIAEMLSLPLFPEWRIEAERRVAGDRYDLADIYREIARISGLEESEVLEIQELEFELERHNVIPIAENMAELRDTDVLVSDMYLSEGQIAALLRAAGLRKEPRILVRPRGKISGESWEALQKKFLIESHLGDNRAADLDAPARYGIPGRLTELSKLSPIETMLANAGLSRLALAVREARLALWNEDSSLFFHQTLQAQINFPLLYVSSLHLADVVVPRGSYETLLMCSRDCVLWQKLFAMVATQRQLACSAAYFHTNRSVRRNPSRDYLAYVRSQVAGKTLMVDLSGTGVSGQLLSRNAAVDFDLYYLIDLRHGRYSEALRSKYGIEVALQTEFLVQDGAFDNSYLEVLNYAQHPTLEDVVQLDETTFVPRFRADVYPTEVARTVAAMHEAFTLSLGVLEKHGIDAPVDGEVYRRVAGELLKLLRGQNLSTMLRYHYMVEHSEGT